MKNYCCSIFRTGLPLQLETSQFENDILKINYITIDHFEVKTISIQHGCGFRNGTFAPTNLM